MDQAILSQLTSEQDAKQYIGETIYPFIEAAYRDDASKLTGMILASRSVPELLQYCSNRDIFYAIIGQAFQVLSQARQQEAAQA